MKFLTGLSIQQWSIIGIAVFALIFYGVFQHSQTELGKAKTEVAVQKVQIAVQKDTLATNKVVAVIAEATQVATQKAVKAATVKHAKIQETVISKEQNIERHFADLPVTSNNAEKEQQQLSTVRIDGLWEAYCMAAPEAATCLTPPPGA